MSNLYDYLFFFLTYSFLGWCAEVCFCSINTGKFVNRGFLNGPLCPIYGFGMVALIFFLTPVKDNLIVLFIASFFLTTILEGLTGYFMKKLFHTVWWDYSDQPFNIGGYVCLSFSLMWAVGGSVMMLFVHPTIAWLLSLINHSVGTAFLWVALSVFTADCVVTVATIAKLNKDMELLNMMAAQLEQGSQALAMRLGNSAIRNDKKFNRQKDEMLEHFEELKAGFINSRSILRSRLIKAFPNMKHEKFNDWLEELKKRYYK